MRVTKEQAKEKIKTIVSDYQKFRLGITGQDLRKSFDSVYRDQFDDIFPIVKCSDKNSIQNLEKEFITYFTGENNYQGKILNESDENVATPDVSDIYRLFVLVRN
jgi:hypothetical protein